MTTMNREEQKQVLIDTANHIIHRDNTSPYSENLRELARIALAALEVEPIGFRCRRNDNLGDWSYVYHREPDDFERKHLVIEGIYAAPPETVSVPDAMEMDDDFDSAFEHGKAVGWNAYRAAMFQSGNFRENKNSSTNNFREIAETSTSYPVITSEVLSAIQKVAKIRADFDDFDGDRRGIGDCLDEAEQELIVTINKYASQLAVVLVGLDERAAFNAWNNEENLPIAGVSAKNAAWLAWQARAELGRSLAVNSPVTPDGWISCSDRMPEKNQNVLISVNFDSSLVEPLICSARYTGSTFRRGDATIKPGNGIEQATHWMPLPEPPQGVK